jgi:hypothetical protein
MTAPGPEKPRAFRFGGKGYAAQSMKASAEIARARRELVAAETAKGNRVTEVDDEVIIERGEGMV